MPLGIEWLNTRAMYSGFRKYSKQVGSNELSTHPHVPKRLGPKKSRAGYQYVEIFCAEHYHEHRIISSSYVTVSPSPIPYS